MRLTASEAPYPLPRSYVTILGLFGSICRQYILKLKSNAQIPKKLKTTTLPTIPFDSENSLNP